MKKRAISALLLALCGMAAFGQELPRVVVLPLENRAGGRYDQSVETLTEILSSFINETLRLNVIDRFALDAAMAARRWQMNDWADNTKTAEMGRALNASYILRGNVAPLGDNLIVSARILDISTAEVRSSSNIQLEHMNEAYSKMNSLAQLLTYNLGLPIQPAQQPVQQAQQPVAAAPPPEPAQKQEQVVNNGPVEFHLTIFNFGVEMHIPWAFQGSLDLMVLGLENRATGLGVEFSPAHLYGWIRVGEKEPSGYDGYVPPGYDPEPQDSINGELGWSILNLTLFWNLMPLIASEASYYLAPFVGFNYLIMSDTIHPEQFMFSAGLSVGRRRGDSIKYNSFSVEAGYRMIAHQITAIGGTPHRMFIGIKLGR
jgi:TolB-like protein